MNRDGDADFLDESMIYPQRSVVHKNSFIDGFKVGFGVMMGVAIAGGLIWCIFITAIIVIGISI